MTLLDTSLRSIHLYYQYISIVDISFVLLQLQTAWFSEAAQQNVSYLAVCQNDF